MSNMVLTKIYSAPPINKKEILRYAGCKGTTEEIDNIIEQCISEIADKLTYKVCYRVLDVKINDGCCDFGLFSANSKSLAKNLCGCKNAVLFAATVGIELDRIIAKYNRISPSKALFFQAIGAERVEALCDAFCDDIKAQFGACCPRFSPGYADLDLQIQKQVISLLDCSKQVGITLNDSLLMSPSKSVTAFVGIKGENI